MSCFVKILTYNAYIMSNNILETFENPNIDRDYTINFEVPEFTSLCPKTGQPDFANILIEYIPDKLCVELKSLKLYFVSYRDQPGFHEDLTNKILDDLVALLNPKYMNCLLYTSPSPRDGLLSRMPSSA